MPILSDVKIRAAKAKEAPYKMFDTDGLFLIVTPKGQKWWRLRYTRPNGKSNNLSLGVYDKVGLREARQKRDEALALLAQGIDPGAQRRAIKATRAAAAENAFERVAREWFASHIEKLAPTYSKKVISLFERKIFPVMGEIPITEIKPAHILEAARHMADNDRLETAHRIIQLCGQFFKYCIATGRPVYDITAGLHAALPKTKVKHMATILEPARIGQLLRAIYSYRGYFPTCCALKLIPLFMVRPGNLAKAEWTEFDLANQQWIIPAHKMKMRQTHIVPLCRQAMGILTELKIYTGNGRFVFPSYKSELISISDNTMRTAIISMGFAKEEIVPHGFRSMASTLLNGQGFNPDWIERQLAHSASNTIRGTYNFADYLPERRRMMQAWADYLDTLRDKAS